MTITGPGVVDAAVNPNNTDQRYILWGTGRIDNINAPAVTTNPQWYDRLDQPVAIALHITDWATGAGYVLDVAGGFHPFGGAPSVGTASTGEGHTHEVVVGIPYAPFGVRRWYVDWHWNPANNGQGYVLDAFGKIWHFGGALQMPRFGNRWTRPVAHKLEVWWGGGPIRAYTLDLHGGIHPDGDAVPVEPFDDWRWATGPSQPGDAPYWKQWQGARDLVVTDFANGGGYTLDANGGCWAWGTAPGTFSPEYRLGVDRARVLKVLNAGDPWKYWEVWSYGQVHEWTHSFPPKVTAGAGESEQQKVEITGGPTGGTFTLTYSGSTTAAIAYNATAATVRTALEALPNIGAGNVTVTGGPGPGTAWTVTFAGALSQQDVAQMTATSALTGGTTPAVAVSTVLGGMWASPPLEVTTTTRPMLAWSYSDPERQVAWEVYVFRAADVTATTDPTTVPASTWRLHLTGVDPQQRGVRPDHDFVNGTYRYFVRAQDSALTWSPWDSRAWTQNVPVPVAPTGMAAVGSTDPNEWLVNLSVAVAVGGPATHVRFEYSDDGQRTWHPVRGAEAVPRQNVTTAVDYDSPMGRYRSYRAVAYSEAPRVASVPSESATGSSGRLVYVLTSTRDPSLGGEIMVVDAPTESREAKAGVFQTLGDPYYFVVSDGVPKARKLPVGVDTNSEEEWLRLKACLESNATLVYRDPFGSVIYCRMVGTWQRTQVKRAPYADEVTPWGHKHKVTFDLVEVRAPVHRETNTNPASGAAV